MIPWITFNGSTWSDVDLILGEYQDGSLSITLQNEQGAITTATVWVDQPLSPGCVWIKNYSENHGILEALTNAGVLEPTGRVAPLGMGHADEARLILELSVVTLASDYISVQVNVMVPKGVTDEEKIDIAHDLARDAFTPQGDDGQGPFFASIHSEVVT